MSEKRRRSFDWSKVNRQSTMHRRTLGPAKLPPIIRNRILHHEFKEGASVLEVFEDNEEHTYEAVLTRTGLPTRSCRVRKEAGFEEILRALLSC